MEAIFKIILYTHIAAGSISLILFWIPVLVKKGSKVHNKIGMVYVYFMWIVVISAGILCCLNLFRGRPISAAFLGFLTLLTGHPLWYAIVVLKYKKEVPKRIYTIRKVMNWTLFVAGFGLITWSMILKLNGPSVLLLIFGILGVVSAFPLIRQKEASRMNSNWLAEHLEGMVGTGIAAYTAFLAFGGGNFFADIFSGPLIAIPWSLPTIIGVIVITRMKKKMGLQLKFGK